MPTYRLTAADVLRARKLWRQGWTKAELAGEFGVSGETVFSAVRGYTWKHLPGACPKGIKYKLTAEKVRRARELWHGGRRISDLARRFKVSETAMSNAVRGNSWRNAGGEPGWALVLKGEDRPAAKLTEASVREARRCYRDGMTMGELAARLGVSRVVMTRAVRGLTWRHVPGAVSDRLRSHAQAGRM